jgi:hypothetical protein
MIDRARITILAAELGKEWPNALDLFSTLTGKITTVFYGMKELIPSLYVDISDREGAAT